MKDNPANIQEFYSFSAKKGSIAQKSCIIAGIYNNENKTGKNDVFLHHFLDWQQSASLLAMPMHFSSIFGSIEEIREANGQFEQTQ